MSLERFELLAIVTAILLPKWQKTAEESGLYDEWARDGAYGEALDLVRYIKESAP